MAATSLPKVFPLLIVLFCMAFMLSPKPDDIGASITIIAALLVISVMLFVRYNRDKNREERKKKLVLLSFWIVVTFCISLFSYFKS